MDHPDWDSMSLHQQLNYRNRTIRRTGGEPGVRSVVVVAQLGRTGEAKRPQVRDRAPRAAGARTHGSRRTSSSSRSSGTDPGSDDPEPDPAPRLCAAPGCEEDISHRRADATTCSGRCRKALKRTEDAWRAAQIDRLGVKGDTEEKAERDAWHDLAAPERSQLLYRSQMAPPEVDAEVLAIFIEDTAGRVAHGRRRRAVGWSITGPIAPVIEREAVVA